ncbi:MAG TPA: TetR/AcrR family transcriptional regulator [Cyclobacteriaceae bacterium]|nr:TetR/AcrR family transcriptional regulator [Cyclobacteriaceae bacterium]
MRTRDEDKIDALKEEAITMIAKEGLNGFSIQKLAKAVGVSPATIYIYYKDKEDLIISVGAEVTRDLLDRSMKNFTPEMSFAEGLKTQWKNRAQYFIDNPIKVEFVEQLRYSQLYNEVMKKVGGDFKVKMSQFVCGAIEKGEIIKLPFEVYWSVAFAPLYQLIKFHTQGKSYVNDKYQLSSKQMNQTLDLVLKALKP